MMPNTLEELLVDALERKRQKCSYETTYSHENIKVWLESSIEMNNWKVFIPTYSNKRSCGRAISQWPSKVQRSSVLRLLKSQNCNDPEDLLEGSCEPLAFYLSVSVQTAIQARELEELNVVFDDVSSTLKKMKPLKAAEIVYQSYINPHNRGPIFWSSTFQGLSCADFLFGTEAMKTKVENATQEDSSISYMPLYVLNYIFDKDELNDADMTNSTLETAQYSCHAVGLIFDRKHRRIVVADPNGALVPGYNMEFLKVPLTERSSPPSTKVSSFDLEIDAKRSRKKRKNDDFSN
jgi:hypothetical protein